MTLPAKPCSNFPCPKLWGFGLFGLTVLQAPELALGNSSAYREKISDYFHGICIAGKLNLKHKNKYFRTNATSNFVT